MKDEIKEILEWLNDKNYYIEDFGYKFKRLSLEENETLLDYITNLQEENVVLKSQLLQDNKSYYDMQDRIKKAIEYIKSLCYIESNNEWFTYGDDLSPEHIVNILQGKSDE